jgi:NTE family protein
MGLYPGTYLYEWLGPILSELDAETFGKLRVTQTDDPGMSLPIERQYRLLVHTSDVTRRVLARLPWDCGRYGKQPDSMAVVDAVRASMSIPFFFEPFKFDATEATVNVPMPGGRTAAQRYAGGTVTWVDGGMLRNFPITAFDRIDGKPPRWPTIGIKLNSFDADSAQTTACAHTLGLATDCVQTMMNEWDDYAIESATAARTIFINNDGITATQFDLGKAQQDSLFKNGVAAATEFIIDMGQLGYVPKDAAQGLQLAQLRVALTAAAPPPSP